MDHELIAQVVQAVMARLSAPDGPQGGPPPIPVEVSGRHVHLSRMDFETLFGPGKMEKASDISQPGQFLSAHRVRLIGPRGAIDRVAVLGPPRKQTQVEVSLTDAVALGLRPPVRQSGDLAGSADIYIQAGEKMLFAASSAIVAARHLHMTPADAACCGVENGQTVDVLLEGGRPLILRGVLVRADDAGKLGLHIDFDEANAAGVRDGLSCRILNLNLENAEAPRPVDKPVRTAARPEPARERLLRGEAGKAALLTGKMAEEYAREGVRVIRAQGRTLVTAQARDVLRRNNMELLQS